MALELESGQSVMRAAVDAGVDGVEAQCGGQLSCATCHCYVLEGFERLAPPSEAEALMLENVAAQRRVNSRLSCQLKVTPDLDGLTVQFPDRQS